jgi:hypothetical protein
VVAVSLKKSTYFSDDGPPESVPPVNVQIIAQATIKEGRVLISGHDFYWWDSDTDQWMGGDQFGLYDHLMRHSGVKFARSMRTADFETLFQRAVADPDLPRKSATNYPREERR